MNSNSFLQMVSEKLKLRKDNPIIMYIQESKAYININNEVWMADTFDQCILQIKQSLAIKYLEQL